MKILLPLLWSYFYANICVIIYKKVPIKYNKTIKNNSKKIKDYTKKVIII